MAVLANMIRKNRTPGGPRVEHSGPSSMTGYDRLARALGWFSLGLGVAELVAPRRISKALGLEGKERLIQAYGVREVAAGIPTLSVDKQIGLVSRIAGDAVDLATLAPALRHDNPKRRNALVAVTLVTGITLLDIIAAAGTISSGRRSGTPRNFSDRSGLPDGVERSRGLARHDARQRIDLREDTEGAASGSYDAAEQREEDSPGELLGETEAPAGRRTEQIDGT